MFTSSGTKGAIRMDGCTWDSSRVGRMEWGSSLAHNSLARSSMGANTMPAMSTHPMCSQPIRPTRHQQGILRTPSRSLSMHCELSSLKVCSMKTSGNLKVV
jgi:hypothetical protein